MAPLLGTLVHAVHYLLVVGGLVGIGLLVVLSRPGASRPARHGRRAGTAAAPGGREEQLALLRAAAAGGTLATPKAVPARPARAVATPTGARDLATRLWLPVALVSSAAAAGVHGGATPGHLGEGALVGAFFVTTALGQLVWSLAVALVGPRPALLEAALVGNLLVVAVWLVSRTGGLPLGPGGVEPVGAWDLAATGWEVAVVVGVSKVLTSGRIPHGGGGLLDIVRWTGAARGWLLGSAALLLVLTTIGLPG